MKEEIELPVSPRVAYSISRLEVVTSRSARSWIRDIRAGKLRAIRLGGRILVTHEALMEYLRANEDNSGATVREPPRHIQARVEAKRQADAGRAE